MSIGPVACHNADLCLAVWKSLRVGVRTFVHRETRAKIDTECALKARAIRRLFAPRRDAACEPIPLMRLCLCRLHLRIEGNEGSHSIARPKGKEKEKEKPARPIRRHRKNPHNIMQSRASRASEAGEKRENTHPKFSIVRDGASSMAWEIGSGCGRGL